MPSSPTCEERCYSSVVLDGPRLPVFGVTTTFSVISWRVVSDGSVLRAFASLEPSTSVRGCLVRDHLGRLADSESGRLRAACVWAIHMPFGDVIRLLPLRALAIGGCVLGPACTYAWEPLRC